MKATRANLLGEFTGKLDDLIYYRRRPGGKIYVRKQFKFENHPGQPGFASAQKAIYALKPSAGYQRNLKDYLILYNKLSGSTGNNAQAWTNIYNKLMFAMQKKMQVQLKTIPREQITQSNLPCRTVKEAIEAGLLPEVKDYERFTNLI